MQDVRFAAECWVVLNRKRLPVMLRLGYDHAVDEDAGYLDLSRIERTTLRDPLDLGDDHAI